MNCLEFFCGRGSLTKLLKQRGHSAISFDIRKRKGVCQPDIRKNILDITIQDFPFPVDFIYAAVPCTAFSFGAGDFYFKNGMFKDNAQPFLNIARKTFQLIEENKGAIYFIENPRGHLRNWPEMKQFLYRTNGTIKEISLSSYGFPTTKPTDIFTNAKDFKVKPMARFGSGAKCIQAFGNLTICQRQATPENLYRSIIDYLENLPGTKTSHQLKFTI